MLKNCRKLSSARFRAKRLKESLILRPRPFHYYVPVQHLKGFKPVKAAVAIGDGRATMQFGRSITIWCRSRSHFLYWCGCGSGTGSGSEFYLVSKTKQKNEVSPIYLNFSFLTLRIIWKINVLHVQYFTGNAVPNAFGLENRFFLMS